MEGSPIIPTQLPFHSVWCSTGGHLWVTGPGAGLIRFDGTNEVRFGQPQGLRSEDTGPVAAAPDGGLWLAVGTNAIARFDGTNFAYLTPRDGLPHGVVTALHAAPSGELWVGLFTAGASYNEGGYVARFDGKSFTAFSRHDEAMGTQSGYPAGMCFDIQTGPGGGTLVWRY